MNRYNTLRVLGDGSFGTVLEAINTETNEKVSCSVLTISGRYQENEKEIFLLGRMHRSKRSKGKCCFSLLKSLKKLNNHANIIKLKEVIRENDLLYFVSEFMDGNVYDSIRKREGVYFSAQEVKIIV